MREYLLVFILLITDQLIFPQQFTLDTAANTAALEISQIIPSESSFAVFSIRSLSDEFSLHIITRLESALLNTRKIRIVTRQRIETVMKEQNFGLSGYINDDSAQRFGHLLGARFVLAGNLAVLGNQYSLDIQVFETETGLLIYSKNFEIKNSELKKYEQIIAARERQEQLERKYSIREEERRQREELRRQREEKNEFSKLERKEKWDDFWDDTFTDEDRYWSTGVRIGSPMVFPFLGYTYWYTFWIYGLWALDTQPWETNWFGPFSPVLTLNANATLAPFPKSFFELGVDASLFNPNGVRGSDYMSLFPYAHYNFLFDLGDNPYFIYFGLGTGRMFTLIGSPERSVSYDTIHDTFALDIVLGVKRDLDPRLEIQGIFRYDFQGGYYFNILFGWSYRFE
jgi:TolB-like protein